MQGYKNSGIEWIGSIPSNWKLDKIKYMANLYGRIGWQGLTSEEYIDEGPFLVTGVDFCKGRIDWNNCVHISEKRWEQADKIQIKNEDLLITKDGTVGKVAIVSDLNGKASLNSGVLLIDLKDKNSKKYLYWVLCSDVFWTWFNYKNSGNSTILHLYQKDFNEFIYTIPELKEQKLIANFLDKKGSEINAIIEKIENQINLLKNYKKSLITETVTKGLNKNVSMKDSGIEWIGEIPEEWDVSKIKYSLILMGSGSTPDSSNPLNYDGEINWIQSGDLYGKSYITETEKTITKYALHGNKSLKRYIAPFVVVAMYGASVGNIALSQIDSYTNQACCVMKGDNSLDNKYLYYFLIANKHEMLMLAIGGTQPNISQQLIKNLTIIIPKFNDQLEIVEFLDKKCSEIDSVISKKERQLDLIKGHRKSLIYEYVTGKKRVGGLENEN
ncbi:restriction endonuclease subunit S [Peptostreptococcus anaerobius]|uniref:restriction endonuclease subunit S n=1 Tax=Peptostreptococcus anaerobius TaxID=1261 RepID=UPI00189B96A7|nr:restriction endonuclease subunit S [Peptostreptococcus anaerobius]MDB8850914.1 restriction endonuclease subunit S [Peptostreptococcus anaerobius]